MFKMHIWMQVILFGAILMYTADCRYTDSYYNSKPAPSAILMYKQALGPDGSFNYAFASDNGHQQGETINPDASRSGAYSYVDPDGEKISVQYTADQDGFHVTGDHIPKPAVAVVHTQY